MKIGDSIRVKTGILCPDNKSYDLSGWEGRIIGIDRDDIEIEWNSITLSQMPKEFIQDSIDEGIEYECMTLGEGEIEITRPRDNQGDVQKKQEIIRFNYSFEGEESRIKQILNNEDISVNAKNLETYYKYLKDTLKKPCILTGMEDFSWEEPYIFGGWSKKEYNELKKNNPSYTDKFNLLDFEDEIEDGSGIFVKVKRISDNKIFIIALWDLKVVDKGSNNYQLISDYSSWMTNYQ